MQNNTWTLRNDKNTRMINDKLFSLNFCLLVWKAETEIIDVILSFL